jgi:integrase
MYKVQGAGSLEKRGKNVWRIRFNLGCDPITKKYLYSPWRTVHGTKMQAQAAMSDYRNELESGIKLDADKVTFGEYAAIFCERRKASDELAPATLRHDKDQVRILNGYLERVPLRDIEKHTVKNLIAALAADGRKSHAVRRCALVLYQILGEAVEDDLLLRNPCTKKMLPKVKRPETRYLEPEDVRRLLAALNALEVEAQRLEQTHRATKPRKAHRFEQGKASATLLRAEVMAVRLALATGCRRGEVLGLEWQHLNADDSTLRIVQQNTQYGITPPKTKQGRRTITLDPSTMAALKVWKSRQAEFLLSLGIAQDKETPIVTDILGGHYCPYNFTRWWSSFRDKYGFEGLKFHELRHTHATLLIGDKADIKTVQGRLGHAQASTTLDFYASVMPAKDKEAASIVGKILAAPAPVCGEVVNL